ncbi:arginase family protein [Klugiella xanthotipulae]|uniref:Arginase n=1 Tax=Klugiella xanthotipulae TaxID=244735 RepID=A0A543HY91_9MICO|nr:arginase family protein [Klugiella xanthotipulae]TQM63269.1 arginase [Klugiella xanthotipulae]
MTVDFLVFPQWQGSDSARAMRLVDGADLLAHDLPSSNTHRVEVRSGAGDNLGTSVRRLSSVLSNRDSALAVLHTLTQPTITVGGDCASDLAGVTHAVATHGADNLAVVWFDAHGDLNAADDSPSGAFSGMVLRTLLGEGESPYNAETPIDPARLILVGGRDYGDAELAVIERLGIRLVSSLEVDDGVTVAETVADAVRATGSSHAYLHIDLDVLDPAEFESVHVPVPFGLTVSQLTASIRAVRATAELAGAGICEFAPADVDAAGDDLTTVLRVIAALTSTPTD